MLDCVARFHYLFVMSASDSHNAQTIVANDAFSSGQIGSKIWLCDELERIFQDRPEKLKTRGETVWIYGGWQGALGLLMLSRSSSSAFASAIDKVRSFDIDPACADVANVICENWVWREWKFRAFTKDCNELNPAENGEYGRRATVVVNTSVEHFESREWFEKIPEGTLVVLQASDFEHNGAVSLFTTEADLAAAFPLRETLFIGRLNFAYGSWSFNRLMLIGRR